MDDRCANFDRVPATATGRSFSHANNAFGGEKVLPRVMASARAHEMANYASNSRTDCTSTVAQAVLFLLSSWSKGITGEIVHVASPHQQTCAGAHRTCTTSCRASGRSRRRSCQGTTASKTDTRPRARQRSATDICPVIAPLLRNWGRDPPASGGLPWRQGRTRPGGSSTCPWMMAYTRSIYQGKGKAC